MERLTKLNYSKEGLCMCLLSINGTTTYNQTSQKECPFPKYLGFCQYCTELIISH
jgi:hypothetical protein